MIPQCECYYWTISKGYAVAFDNVHSIFPQKNNMPMGETDFSTAFP